jgi:hypothetical protein
MNIQKAWHWCVAGFQSQQHRGIQQHRGEQNWKNIYIDGKTSTAQAVLKREEGGVGGGIKWVQLLLVAGGGREHRTGCTEAGGSNAVPEAIFAMVAICKA